MHTNHPPVYVQVSDVQVDSNSVNSGALSMNLGIAFGKLLLLMDEILHHLGALKHCNS